MIRWVAQGKTDREIAAILACAPKTVEKHLEHIFDKLEVPNRAAAAVAVAVTLSAPGGADP